MKKYLTPDKRVWAVENFLTEKELADIQDHIASASWETKSGWGNGIFANNTTQYKNIGSIKNKIYEATDKKYNWRGVGMIMRIPVGGEMNDHVDNYNDENDPDEYEYMSCVLYLNDDFTGGEIYYKNLDIEYSPKSGTIVFHPGFEELYRHGVKKVGKSPRYAMGFVGKSLTPKI